MASFLRRKTKQEPATPTKHITISGPTAPASTPVFSKFASGSNGNGTAKVVSGPMGLSSSARRESSRHPTTSRVNGNGGPPPSSRSEKPLPSPGRTTSTRGSPIVMKVDEKPALQLELLDFGRKLSLDTQFLATAPSNASSRRTNLLDDEFDLAPTPRATRQPPSSFQTNGAVDRMSYAVDLPPEVALFQQYGVDGQNPPGPSASLRAAPAPKLNGQQQGRSLGPRSTAIPITQARATNTSPKPFHLPTSAQPHSPPVASPLHSPPRPGLSRASSTMGNNISSSSNVSHYNGQTNGLYPAAVASFQPQNAMMGSSSSAMPEAKPVQYRPSMRRSVLPSPPPPPPPPPGASAPAFSTHSPPLQRAPSFSNPQNVPVNTPGGLFNPAAIHGPVPQRGKPRIFAAMDAAAAASNGDGGDHVPTPTQGIPIINNAKQLPQRRPSQAHHQPLSQSPQLSTSPTNSRLRPPVASSSMQMSPPTTGPSSYTSPAAPVFAHGNARGSQVQPDEQRTPRVGDKHILPVQPQYVSGGGGGAQAPPVRSAPVPLQQVTPRVRKLSKPRQPVVAAPPSPEVSTSGRHSSASSSATPASVESHRSAHQHSGGTRSASKAIPSPALRPGSSAGGHKRSLSRSPTKPREVPQVQEPYQQQQQQQDEIVDEETIRKAGMPLDNDPFAKVDGVVMLPSKEGSIKRSKSKDTAAVLEDSATPEAKGNSAKSTAVEASSSTATATATATADAVADAPPEQTSEERRRARRERRERRAREKEERKARERAEAEAAARASSASVASEYATDEGEVATTTTETEGEAEPVEGHEEQPEEEQEGEEAEEEKEPEPEPVYFPFTMFLSDPQFLANLLSYMGFHDWCILSSVSREIRIMLVQSPSLRAEVLERFLKTVGYSRWSWDGQDPLPLSLQDLADYMRGVSTPSHEYARVAKMYVHSQRAHPSVRDPSLEHTVRCLTASTRAYTRVVLRLRAQAEKEEAVVRSGAAQQRALSAAASNVSNHYPPSAAAGAAKAANGYYANGAGLQGLNGGGSAYGRAVSRASSRAPSPTRSMYAHSSSNHSGFVGGGGGPGAMQHQNASQTSLTFRSPLFRLRRAPLLRVFVPSPEGDWLSDKSVVDCETECRKAGVLHLMRMGDVVWDIAVGDEGNVGRLVYDGRYLIDLDYTYNPIGDLPKYIPTLAFPPSYFHRVIRTGAITSNPTAHINVAPWGEEIAANLQLLQDRVKTETPQGAYHNVVRWVHRSSFVIRPPARVMQRGTSINGRAQPVTPRIPIPEFENMYVDPGWYGMIIVETEGTNEALADLQERCGPRAFPPRARPMSPALAKAKAENRNVFRILREKSRPGEIWVKAVSVKERLL